MKLKFFIDSHKGITLLVMLGLMALYGQWQNPTAWLYVALHGTYGILWVLKSRLFPDTRWEQRTSWLYGVVAAWGGLTLYWIGGWLVMARGVHAPGWYAALCVAIYTVGIFFHFASDMQKYMAMRLNPGHLITDGFFALSRNPNYFGEMLIYLGFGLLAMHWLPVAILALWIVAYWWPSMLRKDRSLARYPDYAAYAARTKRFIPYLV